jgi:hypothetical protein
MHAKAYLRQRAQHLPAGNFRALMKMARRYVVDNDVHITAEDAGMEL